MSNKLYVITPKHEWILPDTINGELIIGDNIIFKGINEYHQGMQEYILDAISEFDMDLLLTKRRLFRDDVSSRLFFDLDLDNKSYKVFLYLEINIVYDKDYIKKHSNQFRNKKHTDYLLLHAAENNKDMKIYLQNLLHTKSIKFE